MKQYLSPDQTAKLIELGFEKPKGWYIDGVTNNVKLYVNIDQDPMMFNYSIGELIEMLPEFSNIYDLTDMHTMKRSWYVGHVSTLNVSADELVDALYSMIVKLKEEGVL